MRKIDLYDLPDDILEEMINNPVFFCLVVFDSFLWSKQREIAKALLKYKKVAVYSCTGAGKSFFVANIVPYFLQTKPNIIIPIVSPSYRSCIRTVWRPIVDMYYKSKIKLMGEPISTRWEVSKGVHYAEVMSARKIESLQGLHSLYQFQVLEESCFDEETEILTDNGWKSIDEFDIEKDKVLTLDIKTMKSIYKKAIKKYVYDYEGDLYYYDVRGCSFAFSSNHRILKWKYQNWKKDKFKYLEFIKMKDIKLDVSTAFFMERDLYWEGEEKEFYVIPSYKYKGKNIIKDERKVKMTDWLEFIGWYLSEGNCTKVGRNVCIAQKKPHNRKRIKALLDRLGFSYFETKNGFVISDVQLAQHLIEKYGRTSEEMKIPKDIKQLSKRQLNILLNALISGDGYYKKDNIMIFYNTNKKLIDDVQEIALKCGYRATLSQRKQKGNRNWIIDHWAISRKDGYVLYIGKDMSKIKVRQNKIKKKKYKGRIWDVCVPDTHTVYVRRKGTCYWTGNSGIEDWIIDALDGNMTGGTNYRLMIGNPLNPNGYFYKTQFNPSYYKVRISAFDTPLLTGEINEIPEKYRKILSKVLPTEEWIRSMEDSYGKDSATYKAKVLGLFPESKDLGMFNLSDIEYAMKAKPEDIKYYDNDDIVITVDPARMGDDYSVITVWKGYVMVDMIEEKKLNLPTLTEIVIRIYEEYNADYVVVDGTGYGSGLYDYLSEKCNAYNFEFGRNAVDEDKYANSETEMMFLFKQALESRVVKLIENDLLKEELMHFEYGFDSKGRFKIVGGKELKSKLRRSPDHAYATALRFAPVMNIIGIA